MKNQQFVNQKRQVSIYLLFIILLSSGFYQISQTGDIKGKITSQTTGVVIPKVNLKLIDKENKVVSEVISDVNGYFKFNQIQAGLYSCEVFLSGYQKKIIRNISVNTEKSTTLNFTLTPVGELKAAEVTKRAEIKNTDVEINYSKHDDIEMNIRQESLGLTSPVTGYQNQIYTKEDYNREGYEYIAENDFNSALQTPLSTFSIDVDRASYANVRRFINKGSLPPVSAVRIEELINYFSYDYPQPKDEHPFSITTEVITCPWNKDHQLALIGLQGKNIAIDHLPPANLVFLIDVSGSMMSQDKLPLLKKSLGLLVNELRACDKVAIAVYAGNAGLVLPSVSGSNKERIMEAINSLEAGGSTAGGAGINLAYKVAAQNYISEGNNRVILATDGDFNVGVSSDGELVRIIEEKRKAGVFLTILGFGTGNYQDAKMEKLADKGNGNYAYIDNIMEAQKTLVHEMGGTLLTIAKDVKLQVEFNPATVKEYKLIGYENRLLHDRDFNDDAKDAGELGSGHTVTALYEIIPSSGTATGTDIDPLKYQVKNLNNDQNLNNDLFTVKFRYKHPQEEKSKLMVHMVKNNRQYNRQGSENIRFASAIAGFGMLLRDSKFKGNADYKMVLSLATDAKGKDSKGYRSEFIRLVEMVQSYSKQTADE